MWMGHFGVRPSPTRKTLIMLQLLRTLCSGNACISTDLRHSRLVTGCLTSLLACCLSFMTSNAAIAETELILKFKAGDVYQQKVTTSTITGGVVAEKPVKTTLQQEMLITTKVESVTESGAGKLTQVIDQITLDIELPNGKSVAYDSNQKEFSDPLLTALHKTLGLLDGAKFQFTVSPRGEFSEFVIPPELAQIAKAQPQGLMGDSLSEASLRRIFEDTSVSLPQGPISKGAKWNRKTNVKLPIGEIVSHLTFTYEGPETETLERIAVGGDIEMTPAEKSPLAVTLNSKKLSGVVLFDKVAGRVESNQIKQVLEVTVAAGGQTNDITIESEVKTKLLPAAKE
ncbi:hypothetical protein Spb1_38930 [Planctopirus ephydatiae]|uniref:Uncharacterized protein n=1 Tax=Planctopirus ephydatiae TaxID=2528019 RepID=A0A518GTM8_9PLAN|nr:DUF6263 family protein [Planctopirus ephydatiae]QDV31946.1 hypothetical protein Spb1_38930 [Planctopirus ephydatiae]